MEGVGRGRWLRGSLGVGLGVAMWVDSAWVVGLESGRAAHPRRPTDSNPRVQRDCVNFNRLHADPRIPATGLGSSPTMETRTGDGKGGRERKPGRRMVGDTQYRPRKRSAAVNYPGELVEFNKRRCSRCPTGQPGTTVSPATCNGETNGRGVCILRPEINQHKRPVCRYCLVCINGVQR